MQIHSLNAGKGSTGANVQRDKYQKVGSDKLWLDVHGVMTLDRSDIAQTR